jgi:ribose transport system substrate-binding protein
MQHYSRDQDPTRRRNWRRPFAALLAAAGASVGVATFAVGASSASTHAGTAASVASASGVNKAKADLAKWYAVPTSITVSTPLKSKPPAGKTLVMLGTTQVQNVQLQQTMGMLAKLVHWHYAVVSYDPANPATFESAITTAITKHANYIFEAGLPLTPQEISQVKAAKAKWVLTSVYPVSVSGPVIADSNSAASDAVQGRILADYFVANSNGKGDAVIEHVPAYSILDGFTNSFVSRVRALCPTCKTSMVDVTIPDLDAGKLVSEVVGALQRDPSANYAVFDDGPFADGITSALAAAGLSKVKVMGEAGDPSGLAAVRAGTEAAWTGFSPVYSAYSSMDAMLRNAENMPIPEPGDSMQPTQLLDKATVGSFSAWNEPANSLTQFKRLWKVK